VKLVYRLGLSVLFAGLAWIALMAYLNSRTTALDVRVAGLIDEVRFYQAARPEQPVATLRTEGQDLSAWVELRNTAEASHWFQGAPAQYYFVAVRGSESYRSTSVCCETGFFSQRGLLTIQDLDDWQQQHR
jgi:hypothetical protein